MRDSELRVAAQSLIEQLGSADPGSAVEEARHMAVQLRNEREFVLLDRLARQLRRLGEESPEVLRLQAQSLVDSGRPDEALDVLVRVSNAPAASTIDTVELEGLKGRAWKQIFFDEKDKTGPAARKALLKSWEHYHVAFEATAGAPRVWPGLNLAALHHFAGRYVPEAGLPAVNVQALVQDMLSLLEQLPLEQCDVWHDASLAEAYLALGNLGAVETHIGRYVRARQVTAFALGGTLRQFTDLWRIGEQGERGRGIVEALRAALLKKDFGHAAVGSREMEQAAQTTAPTEEQLQKILGRDGLRTYQWLQDGLVTARSVGVISQSGVGRIGTGFLVKGADFIETLGERLCVLTNAHVVSEDPKDKAAHPEDASIRFEAVDPARRFDFERVLWSSPKCKLDAALLSLREVPAGIAPLRYTRRLPRPETERVYVIGYPDGGELSFSLQDNLLLDHEGPTSGMPPSPAIRRLHYRAPTKNGSSGSPVLNHLSWQVIALHRAGGDLPRLNGQSGCWPANEGVWIHSIIVAAQVEGSRVADDQA